MKTFNNYLGKVFLFLTIGLGVTTLVSIPLTINMSSIMTEYGDGFKALALISLFVELVVAMIFSSRLLKMSKAGAWICYLLFSGLTGLSLSIVLSAYTTGIIALAFGITTGMFAVLAVLGLTTKIDLSKYSTLALTGLLFLIIASIVNLFLHSNWLTWIITYLDIIVFLFLVAFDTQKIKDYYEISERDNEAGEKFAIYGAFQLYLDFINLFLDILRILGVSKSND